MTGDQVVEFLGRVFVYGVPSVGIVWLIFQKAVDRWVDAHFSKRQKLFEHDQAKELQRLKVKIDTVIQGTLRLQEREFKLLPEAWEKISEAFGLVIWLTSPFQQFPSIEYLTVLELDEYLENTDCFETQKQKIRDANWRDRNKILQVIEVRKRSVQANKAVSDADRFIKNNGVFLPLEILERMIDLKDKTWNCLVAHQVGSEAKEFKMINEGWKKLKDEGEPLHKSIELAIRNRFSEQALLAG